MSNRVTRNKNHQNPSTNTQQPAQPRIMDDGPSNDDVGQSTLLEVSGDNHDKSLMDKNKKQMDEITELCRSLASSQAKLVTEINNLKQQQQQRHDTKKHQSSISYKNKNNATTGKNKYDDDTTSDENKYSDAETSKMSVSDTLNQVIHESTLLTEIYNDMTLFVDDNYTTENPFIWNEKTSSIVMKQMKIIYSNLVLKKPNQLFAHRRLMISRTFDPQWLNALALVFSIGDKELAITETLFSYERLGHMLIFFTMDTEMQNIMAEATTQKFLKWIEDHYPNLYQWKEDRLGSMLIKKLIYKSRNDLHLQQHIRNLETKIPNFAPRIIREKFPQTFTAKLREAIPFFHELANAYIELGTNICSVYPNDSLQDTILFKWSIKSDIKLLLHHNNYLLEAGNGNKAFGCKLFSLTNYIDYLITNYWTDEECRKYENSATQKSARVYAIQAAERESAAADRNPNLIPDHCIINGNKIEFDAAQPCKHCGAKYYNKNNRGRGRGRGRGISRPRFQRLPQRHSPECIFFKYVSPIGPKPMQA